MPIAKLALGLDETDPEQYQLEREAWRKRQTDSDIRALAYEWRIGMIDDCTEDAWIEYQARFGDGARGPHQEFSVKTPRRRAKRDSKHHRKQA